MRLHHLSVMQVSLFPNMRIKNMIKREAGYFINGKEGLKQMADVVFNLIQVNSRYIVFYYNFFTIFNFILYGSY